MHTVLARKWRPQDFKQVLGQDHVTQTLSNAIAQDRLAHAYLFSGPRGVGKTSIARILAKCLNCIDGPTEAPCGECASCREIAVGQSMDVVEIDGASNRRIDDVREIEEYVHFVPVQGQYKIYIIDEVHMLTREAFNALLKTLEEPPSHVKFFFATTEPEKIPETILSRCQHFQFRRLQTADIVVQLQMIAQSEHRQLPEHILFQVARSSQGAMRDAQMLLEQLLAVEQAQHGEQIEQHWQAVLGFVPQDQLRIMTLALLEGDAVQALSSLQHSLQQGQDVHRLWSCLLQYVRDITVAKACYPDLSVSDSPAMPVSSVESGSTSALLELSPEQQQQVQELASQASLEHWMYIWQALMRLEDVLRRSDMPQVPLEMTLIKLSKLNQIQNLQHLKQKLSANTEVIAKPTQVQPMLASAIGPRQPKLSPVLQETVPQMPSRLMCAESKGPENECPSQSAEPPSKSAPTSSETDQWHHILALVKKKRMPLAMVLSKCEAHWSQGSQGSQEPQAEKLHLIFPDEEQFCLQNAQMPRNLEFLQQLLEQQQGRPVQVQMSLKAEYAESPQAVTQLRTNSQSAGQDVAVSSKSEKLLRHNQEVLKDPLVHAVIGQFQGKVLNIHRN